MNFSNNNRLILAGSVFLLLVGSLCFSPQFLKKVEIEVLLRNELNQFATNEAPTFGGMQSSDNQLITAANNNLPTFKKKSQYNSRDISNTEVDFPSNFNLETIEANKKSTPTAKKEVENTSNSATYSYAQQRPAASYSTNNQNFSSKTTTFQTNNAVQSVNTGIQAVAYPGTKGPAISNNANNSFLANNSLSLSTDLSDNNSPMMIDGDSNPGDPGVPVGDGTWVLMGLLVGYGLIKILKWI